MTRAARRPAALVLLGALYAATPALAGDPETDLAAAINALGRLNGEALACSAPAAAGRAKALMLAYAPKERRVGEAYEQATSAAYRLRTAAGTGCHPTGELGRDIEDAGTILRLEAARVAGGAP